MKCGWEHAINVTKKLKYELIHVEEDKIYITTEWNLDPNYKFIIDNLEFEDDAWVFIRILNNIIKDLLEKFKVNITKISKIRNFTDFPLYRTQTIHFDSIYGEVVGENKKLGSKRIILGQKINGFVWKEIAFVENFKKRSPGCSGGGGLAWKWGYDEELIDYEEDIPDIVRRKVSLNSFRNVENKNKGE